MHFTSVLQKVPAAAVASIFQLSSHWKYVRAQRQDNVGVAPLLNNGVLHTDSLSKACILNKQFVSVFTREEVTDIPKLHGPNYPDITDLGISTEGLRNSLVI